jgi:Mg2+-importing ATPase
VILAGSIGLGFVDEYRAARAAQALHSQLRHSCTAHRDGHATSVDVAHLVPGDVVELELGDVVPADIRLLSVTSFECDESVLTGESEAVTKSVDPVAAGVALGDLTSCALMGTVVRAGSARGVVVADRQPGGASGDPGHERLRSGEPGGQGARGAAPPPRRQRRRVPR